MPWVQRHRRRIPYSWFRTTTVRSHYRRPPGRVLAVWAVVGVVVLLLLLALFA
jgi:hypothetical protein